MNTIHKFQVQPGDNYLALPANAKILSAVNQRGVIIVYVLLDPDAEKIERMIHVYTTDCQVLDNPASMVFIGTVLLHQGDLVFHVFELI